MARRRVHDMSVAAVYPLYLAKPARKGRTEAELVEAIGWLTGHDARSLAAVLADGTTFERFFAAAPAMNPARLDVTGTSCGVRVEAIDDPVLRDVRVLDKLVDELARGRTVERVLRRAPAAGAVAGDRP